MIFVDRRRFQRENGENEEGLIGTERFKEKEMRRSNDKVINKERQIMLR